VQLEALVQLASVQATIVSGPFTVNSVLLDGFVPVSNRTLID